MSRAKYCGEMWSSPGKKFKIKGYALAWTDSNSHERKKQCE